MANTRNDQPKNGSNLLLSIDDYTAAGKAPETEHKHIVEKVTENSTGNLYFAKHEPDLTTALREVAAQEIIRVLCPGNVETKIAFTADADCRVLSRGVSGFKSLYDLFDTSNGGEGQAQVIRKINDGTYTGLGALMVAALLTTESDLHSGNIGVDDKGKFTKIDGDWTSARLRYSEGVYEHVGWKFDITPAVIGALPALPQLKNNPDYMPYNWFDQITAADIHDKTTFISALDENIIRKEVNETILKALLMPADYYEKIISHQTVDKTEYQTIYIELMNSRMQLLDAACKNPEFVLFMQDQASTDLAFQFSVELSQHRLLNDIPLADDFTNFDRVMDKFNQLSAITHPAGDARDQLDSISKFIDADTSLKNKHGDSLCILAVESGNLDLVQNYLYANPDLLNIERADGYTPLLIAIKNNDRAIYGLLVDAGAEHEVVGLDGNSALTLAAAAGNLDIVKKVLADGYDIKYDNFAGETALHHAAREGHFDIVKYLMAEGATVNVTNKNKQTPLELAARNGQSQIVEHMLEHAKIFPLHLNNALLAAIDNLHDDAAKLILAKCSVVNAVSREVSQHTPLIFAARNGNDEMVGLLIKKMDIAGINHLDINRSTALIEAVEQQNFGAMQMLLNCKDIDITHKRADGESAISLLVAAGKDEFAKKLESMVTKTISSENAPPVTSSTAALAKTLAHSLGKDSKSVLAKDSKSHSVSTVSPNNKSLSERTVNQVEGVVQEEVRPPSRTPRK